MQLSSYTKPTNQVMGNSLKRCRMTCSSEKILSQGQLLRCVTYYLVGRRSMEIGTQDSLRQMTGWHLRGK
jgi:hypothetical protein